MAEFYYSAKHACWVKDCWRCGVKYITGEDDQDKAEEVLSKYFSRYSGADDGFQGNCRQCDNNAKDEGGKRTIDNPNGHVTLLRQNGKCAICQQSIAFVKINGEVQAEQDHCHDTELSRGILCGACNRLMHVIDTIDIDMIPKAISYKEEWEIRHTNWQPKPRCKHGEHTEFRCTNGNIPLDMGTK